MSQILLVVGPVQCLGPQREIFSGGTKAGYRKVIQPAFRQNLGDDQKTKKFSPEIRPAFACMLTELRLIEFGATTRMCLNL